MKANWKMLHSQGVNYNRSPSLKHHKRRGGEGDCGPKSVMAIKLIHYHLLAGAPEQVEFQSTPFLRELLKQLLLGNPITL